MTNKILLAILSVAVLTACGLFKHSDSKVEEIKQEESSTALPTNVDGVPNQTDVDRVQKKFPGYTLTQLNEGRDLYEAYCAICHELEKPSSESEGSWRKIVPEMVVKANRKTNNAIDASGEEKILRYVITMGPAQKN